MSVEWRDTLYKHITHTVGDYINRDNVISLYHVFIKANKRVYLNLVLNLLVLTRNITSIL